jgi:hypothetical protein
VASSIDDPVDTAAAPTISWVSRGDGASVSSVPLWWILMI